MAWDGEKATIFFTARGGVPLLGFSIPADSALLLADGFAAFAAPPLPLELPSSLVADEAAYGQSNDEIMYVNHEEGREVGVPGESMTYKPTPQALCLASHWPSPWLLWHYWLS